MTNQQEIMLIIEEKSNTWTQFSQIIVTKVLQLFLHYPWWLIDSTERGGSQAPKSRREIFEQQRENFRRKSREMRKSVEK